MQMTWILNDFFRLLPKTFDFAAFYFQPGDSYYSTFSLASETQSNESACSYFQLQISLHTLWFTGEEVVVYGLCGKEIFEKLSSK